jgi:AmiR/NasT family two-component response regulator
MTAAPDAAVLEPLLRELHELRTENAQLRRALESRIAIEQAKGVLSERFGVSPDEAFDAIRRAARNESRKLKDVAEEVLGSTRTPAAVAREVDRRPGGGSA